MGHLALVSLLLSAATSVQCTVAQPRDCPQWINDIGNQWVANNPRSPGLQLLVSSPRCGLECKTSFRSTAANYSSAAPLLPDTTYRIASVTKPFVALAALKLFEDGNIDLHVPVARYLPDWAGATLARQQGASNASKITTWMLLHHTSGMPGHDEDPGYAAQWSKDPNLQITVRDVLEWSAARMKPLTPPGATFHYSDTGYIYLGLVVSHVSGLSLAAAVRKTSKFDELGMSSTYWELYEKVPPAASERAGQYLGPEDWTNTHASFDLYGGGGLVSNVADMSIYARAVHNGKLLEKRTMKLLYTLAGPYGCGWFRSSPSGEPAWSHPGYWGIQLFYFPRIDLVVSGAVNQANLLGATYGLINEIAEKVQETTPCKTGGFDWQRVVTNRIE